MDCISATEAAEKWNTGLRQVQRLLASGRIPDAKKCGNSWVIPAGAEKPGDPRFEKHDPQDALPSELDKIIGDYEHTRDCCRRTEGDRDKMDYISATEAAEKWGVTPRQVQRLLASSRIPGAKKCGNSWVIPAGAEKPGDSRFKKHTPQGRTPK